MEAGLKLCRACMDGSAAGHERFRIGMTRPLAMSATAFPSTAYDLYRSNGDSFLADDRDGHHLILAQMHVLFLKFHNLILSYLGGGIISGARPIGGTMIEEA